MHVHNFCTTCPLLNLTREDLKTYPCRMKGSTAEWAAW
jgi:hypothetical protein